MLKRNRPDNVVFSLDSDILFALAYLRMTKDNPNLKSAKEESSQDVLANKEKRAVAEKLIELYENSEVEFFVSPPVYIEARNSKYATDFIINCCFMPPIITNDSGEDELEGVKEVDKLAREYVKPRYYIDKKDGIEKKTNSAMISKPNVSNFDLYEPTSDAYIMAWSTIYGFELLTNNADHFISYGRFIVDNKTGETKKDAYRRKAIREINEREGWIVSIKNGKRMTTAPHGLLEYGFIINGDLKVHARNTGDLNIAMLTIDFLEKNIFEPQDNEYYSNEEYFEESEVTDEEDEISLEN